MKVTFNSEAMMQIEQSKELKVMSKHDPVKISYQIDPIVLTPSI